MKKRFKKKMLLNPRLRKLKKKISRIESAENYLEKERARLVKAREKIRVQIKKEKKILELKQKIKMVKIRKK